MEQVKKPATYQLGQKTIEPWKPLDAIYAKCMDCCGFNPSEAEKRGYKVNKDDLNEANQERINCQVKTCPLWEFRQGKNPYLPKGTGNADAFLKGKNPTETPEE